MDDARNNRGRGTDAAYPDFLSGGGEMGALMRAYEWSKTPFGAVSTWPQSLRSAVSICLGTNYPIAIYWGPELALLYNDAWSPIPGGKHPWALGRPGREVWPEIWDTIGPLYEKVQTTGEGVWQQDQLLPMHRHGYTEECYFNFTFSPIRGELGRVEGIFNAVVETTFQVISQRRERTLRELAERVAAARSEGDVFGITAQTLAGSLADFPFFLLYRLIDGQRAELAGAGGLQPGQPAAPPIIDATDATAPWPLARVLQTGRPETIDRLSERFGHPFSGGIWPESAQSALLVPIAPPSRPGSVAGFLIAGISPRRVLDDDYRAFIERAAAHVGAAVGNARAYEEERRRAEALAAIDEAKTLFFSNVSHEFRTPLTLMLGPLEESVAAAERLPPDERERVAIAHRNGLRLLKLVNSLLDFSRIEAGRINAHFEPTDLAALTAELAGNFRAATEKAGLELVVDCEGLPEPVYVDREMWEKVVLNLLSNAFKFTFAGRIVVEVAAHQDKAIVTVRDTGTGIPARELPRMFERFHRVEGARGRSIEGSGIGLALVHELVKLHGGTIEVGSEEGRGTTFTIALPFGSGHLPPEQVRTARPLASTAVRASAYVDEALRWLPDAGSDTGLSGGAALSHPASELPATSERAHVLLADDNADMRAYIRRLLEGRHEVQPVADGQAALEAIRARRPDLVLTDIMMPRLDGFGLIRAIREDPALRDLPVIVLSARAGEEARVGGLEAGADDYLVKPFPPRELIARVEGNLKLSRLRREATAELRALNATLEQRVAERTQERDRIWRVSTDLLGVAETSGVWLSINPAWTSTLGWDESEIIGKTSEWLEHPDDRESTRAEIERLAEGAPAVHFENRFRTREGSYRWLSWNAVAEGALLYCAARDVTQAKAQSEALHQAAEQLRQAQKMEAIGKLTGGVAHDFNNLLQVIAGNLQLLQNDVAGQERAEQRVRNALTGVSRGARLASQLLAFGRRQPLSPKVINPGRLIRGMDDMLRRALGEGIEIETVIAGGLWNAHVDPSQVENALLNLAINARDAMEGHGKLTIEAGNALLDDDYSSSHVDVAPGQYVMLAVTDTGPGIPPDLLEQVFDPFFTTKPEGQGTGLGLSMVYGFVKQSGGHVKLYSEPGHGTTVRIYLPRSRQQEDPATDIEIKAVTGGTETILVVEDDEDVRATVVEMLSDLGYRILKAKDADSALAIIESGVPIDLLFTDIVMPGVLRSPELARKARERFPDMAVLFTSGYTQNAIVHGGRLDEGVALLSKPYTRTELARKIRHVLRNQQQVNLSRSADLRESAAMGTTSATGQRARTLKTLLVEDEELIRTVTAAMLTDLGHSVLEAGDAGTAKAILETQSFDVLVTDIKLPDGSGAELAIDASRRIPGLRVIFASGHDPAPEVLNQDGIGKAILLQKPYNRQHLAEALEAVMR